VVNEFQDTYSARRCEGGRSMKKSVLKWLWRVALAREFEDVPLAMICVVQMSKLEM
jgi:hypothetical protein